MTLIDHPGEWLRLSEHYRRMTDGELMKIATERDQLTDVATQVLAMELSARQLKVEADNWKSTKSVLPAARRQSLSDRNVRPTQAADPYTEDRKLVQLLTVLSLRDAMQVQHLLDVASIPFYMGAENATGTDAVTSNFAPGVSVKVMRIGVPWAHQALEHYEPQDVPESEKQHWSEEVDVCCPKCRAKDIVFEEEIPSTNDSAHKYKWTCSVCGNQWEDDGVATG